MQLFFQISTQALSNAIALGEVHGNCMNPLWGLWSSFAAPLRGAEVQSCRFPRVSSATADFTLGYSREVPPGRGPIASPKGLPTHAGPRIFLHAIALRQSSAS